MAIHYKEVTSWIAVLMFVFVQGYEASYCSYTSSSGWTEYKYCSYGCCTPGIYDDSDVCCSYSSYPTYHLSTGIYWTIGASVITVIGVIIAVIVICCCRRQRRTPGTIVNGAPTTMVYSNNGIQTGYIQPGAYPVTQPGYYPAQPGYNPSAPGYPPQPTTPMGYAAPPPAYDTVTGGKDNQAYDTVN